jgi:hypothetical protein
MHRSSETIGAIAEALAKAQGELTNPEKSLTATIPSAFPREENRTFRYASLASGLDIVRKALGEHQIATIQTTGIDQPTGQIHLTTLLAHASGEWIASVWPVCASNETGAPHRMGAALTYARRYALFTLVGIAGEDDIDAPDIEPSQAKSPEPGPPLRKPSNGTVHKPHKQPVLDPTHSQQMRDQLLTEISGLKDGDGLALWAHRRLPAKNTLNEDDARLVEAAYQFLLETHVDSENEFALATTTLVEPSTGTTVASRPTTTEPAVTTRSKPVRRRSKAHLQFVATKPCLICERGPCDAHHLKFAQPRALGRKVSDEFTVPLCRGHHQELHRHGNEAAWWANMHVAPIPIAKGLWDISPVHSSSANATAEAKPKTVLPSLDTTAAAS